MRSILLRSLGFTVAIAALVSALMFLGGLVSRGNMITPFGAGIFVGLASVWHAVGMLKKQGRLSTHVE
ncbi:MAG: hypothetical protein V4476_06750 [Pseudomonadota bacterium]